MTQQGRMDKRPLYFAMWRGCLDDVTWIVTDDYAEFRETIIGWVHDDMIDNYEPSEYSAFPLYPKRPSSLLSAVRYIYWTVREGGGDFRWLKSAPEYHDWHVSEVAS